MTVRDDMAIRDGESEVCRAVSQRVLVGQAEALGRDAHLEEHATGNAWLKASASPDSRRRSLGDDDAAV